ncbi:proteasome subunit alpha [Devriesea agamarum]|uniref:proteasome subunit alpha n=1 Tax=Devriesea agamarum TaxID=472569 RepID=UPI00071CFCF4|nr:proteasome subunit alpha [Devriesea agamarum]
MSAPWYVSPEQLTKDRADFARQGIGRGHSVVVASCANAVALIAQNPSTSLHKLGEIHDRLAFAAVGKYHEFEALRVAGIRWADVRAYQYSRADVSGRGLANAFAQTLGEAFTGAVKPLEVEIVLADVGAQPDEDRLYRLSYDGSVAEEQNLVVIGGDVARTRSALQAVYDPSASWGETLSVLARALKESSDSGPMNLEAAILDRSGPGRCFRRIPAAELNERGATHGA